jgi:DNA-directed RNA polymerase subunit E'
MYVIASKEDVVRIPPNLLGEDFHKLAVRLTQESFQNKVEGDGSYTVKFEALMFRPMLHEIVEGSICEILKFGAFVRFGPLDGLLHISQIMDDRIDIDLDGHRLLGKDTKRELRLGDSIRGRIVSLSINERSPRESKIGLTMRQPGLGKLEWIEEERKKREEKGKG